MGSPHLKKSDLGSVEAIAREGQSRELLQALPVAVYTTDAKGRITYFNDAAAELWGQKPELGTNKWCGSWRLYWPDGRPMPHDQCPMAVALKENRAIRGAEAVAERPDGTRIPFLSYPAPLRDESGALTGAVNTLVDITESKHPGRVTRRLKAIVESSLDAIVSMNLNGIITTWNHGAEQLFGYTAEEAAGQPVTFLYPTDRPDEAAGILARIGRGECLDHCETVGQRKDGSLVEVSISVSPMKDAGGALVGASVIAQDITDRKQAEQARRDAEEQFQVLADNIPALCWMASADGWIYWYNRHWYEYTGTTPESQEGWGWESVHDPKELPAVKERWKASLATGQPFEMVFPLKGADGAFRPFLTRVLPHRDAEGRIVRWFGTNTDISGEREAAARQQLLMDELNHRVKNTLATVQSIAAQLLKGTSDVELRETFDGRLVALSRTHDLLARDSWEAAPLRDLLLQEFEPYRSEEGTRFVVEGPDLGLNPKAALTLGMAFHELATNAAKYGALSKPAGQVRVTWEVSRASGPRALRLKWVETGGPPVKKRRHKGFGSTLIERGLSLELGGEVRVEFDPSGLICTMEIPLAAAGGGK